MRGYNLHGCVAFSYVKDTIKSRHFLEIEKVDFILCKKYVIMKQEGNKRELYKASKRVLWKAQ